MQEFSEMEDYLLPGEQILWKGRPSRISLVLSSYPGFLFGFFFLTFLVLIFIYPVFKFEVSPKEFVPIWLLLVIPWMFLALFFLSYPIFALILYKTQEYVLTNKRILKIHGSKKKSKLLIPISKVKMADIQFGLFDNFCNTARIRLIIQKEGFIGTRHNQYFYSVTNYKDFIEAAKKVIKV